MNERKPRFIKFHYANSQAERLDRYLVACLPEYSRSRIQKFIREGYVTVDNQVRTKTGYLLEGTNMVGVQIPAIEPSNLAPEDIPLDIVFENNSLMVVNKPAGMVVHPSAGHSSGTLVQAALAHAPEMEGIGGVQRPGVVHRLDKNTSGLILLAKNDRSHRWLQDQFRKRKVEKTYIALVDGRPPTSTGRIEAPIGRDIKNRQKMAVVQPQKGRQAISEFRALESFQKHTLLEVHPITGRTHQIRLHLAFLNCPVAGDTTYGKRQTSIPLERHFLHAGFLRICMYGEEEPYSFSADLPQELKQVLEYLRNHENYQILKSQ